MLCVSNGKKPKAFVTACPTRFGSVPHMLERLTHHREHIIRTVVNCPLNVIPAPLPVLSPNIDMHRQATGPCFRC
jgi:hypothetical protein